MIITLLVIIPPAGIALAWTSPWGKSKKIVATVLAGLWFLTPFLSDPPKKTTDDAKPQPVVSQTAAAGPTPSVSPSPTAAPDYVGQILKQAKTAARAAGYNATSHDASPGDASQFDDGNWRICFQTPAAQRAGNTPTLDFAVVRNEWPCPAKDGEPIPYPKMPKVVGLTFVKAAETLKPIALRKIEPRSAYTDVGLPPAVDDWTVCFQEPEEGKELQAPKTTTAYLKVTAPGTSCPQQQNTELHPEPTPPPSTGDDDSDDNGSSSTSGGSSASGGSSTSGGGSSSSGGSSTGGGSAGTVTPGAFCSTPGSTGVGKNGRLYTCKGPSPDRWRP
ncbi:hypothetical protein [Streptomyces sp. NPDC060031]|uniref:hypothetical protein n=1 Tax=Streptomyces sp. NPDC060031 TaxID=3347043 RepID=UPI0036A3AF16